VAGRFMTGRHPDPLSADLGADSSVVPLTTSQRDYLRDVLRQWCSQRDINSLPSRKPFMDLLAVVPHYLLLN